MMNQVQHDSGVFIPPAPLRYAEILQAKRGDIDWRSLVVRPGDDLISSPSTAPGRPRTFLQQPELNTAPFSCEMIKYDNNLFEGLLKPMSRFLRCGAGVKVNLDDYQERIPATKGFEYYLYLDESHPDYEKLSFEQQREVDEANIQLDRFAEAYNSEEKDDYLSININDSMEDSNVIPPKFMLGDRFSIQEKGNWGVETVFYSIEKSWEMMIYAAYTGKKVLIDLSRIRPYGTFNSKGLMASGPIGLGKHEKPDDGACSFFSIYKSLGDYLIDPSVENLLIVMGTVNDTLRRGGFKRGIVTTGMDWRNPNFKEYLDVPLQNLPGGHKKGARITEDILEEASDSLIAKIIDKRNKESLFIAKTILEYPNIFDNVCMGLAIVNYGTCLIWRNNLGKIDVMSDIPAWMSRSAEQLTLMHLNWRSERPEIAKLVATQEEDLQIGLDIMGMANALAKWGISYHAMNESLKKYLRNPSKFIGETVLQNPADRLVYWLAEGYKASTKTCDRICDLWQTPRFKRIHTASEPAQSHSYETTDTGGHKTCRAIYPPIGKSTKKGVKVRRVSNHEKNITAYHGFVETIQDVTPELCWEFCANYNAFVGAVGRSHKYFSLDTYQEMTLDKFTDFVRDDRLYSLYYAEHNNYAQQYLSKSAPSLKSLKRERGECAVCAE